MILSVLVWLAMWGQGQAQKPWDNPIYDDPGIVRPLPQLALCIDNGDDTTTCPNSLLRVIIDHVELPKPKPAEHVIEIKTVREDHGVAKDKRTQGLGGSPYCNKPDDSLEYPNQCHENVCTSMYIAPHCVKLTRELWIDNVKFGIIKGLD